MKPYNEEQVNSLTRYAKRYNIAGLSLNAYVASDSKQDEDGYTKAHNADVGGVLASPDTIGIAIESLLKDHPGTDVTISSAVIVDGIVCHIPMLDYSIQLPKPITDNSAVFRKIKNMPAEECKVGTLISDVARFTEKSLGEDLWGPGRLYVSGHSYHTYGLCREPFPDQLFKAVVGSILVCDHNRIADHAWLGFSLQRGEFRLRLTAVQRKYTMLPTLIRDLPSTINEVAQDYPF